MCSLSYVHMYRIEYVSYRQGPYRIRIISAADRIVPALVARNNLRFDVSKSKCKGRHCEPLQNATHSKVSI